MAPQSTYLNPESDGEPGTTDQSDVESGIEDEDDAYEDDPEVETDDEQTSKEDAAITLRTKVKNAETELEKGLLENDVKLQDEFWRKYEEYLRPRPELENEVHMDERNILYKLARDGQEAVPNSWLVKRLVNKYPELLREEDDTDRNALLVAVTREKLWFIKAVLDSEISDSDLSQLIGPNSVESSQASKTNCIQTAISKDLDAETTIRLIKKASEATLASQDPAGLTPLHHAVSYQKCRESRLAVVMTLIRYGDKALDQTTGKPDKFSVYRYHLETRKRYERDLEKKDLEKRKKKQAESKTTKENPGSTGNSAVNPKMIEEKGKRRHDVGPNKKAYPEAGEKEKRERHPGASNAPVREEFRTLERRPTSQMPMGPPMGKNGPQQLYQANEARQYNLQDVQDERLKPKTKADDSGSVTPSRPKTLTKSKASSSRRIKEQPSKKVADQIAKQLKLYYLRSTFQQRSKNGPPRNHNAAVEFLFGDNKEDKNICFNFPPYDLKKEEKVSFKHFEVSYQGFEFDDVLLYVDFRKLELETPPERPPRRGGARMDSDPGLGRKDIEPFFDWLYKKGVRNIIKVSVEDLEDPPHCDQSIEDSLCRFEIENLDWRKYDLCPEAIWNACKSSKNLNELHLWWSGNNAILRAWSEPDGLVRLQRLKKIHLHESKKRLDSSSRRDANLKEFQRRLDTQRQALGLKNIIVDDHKSEDRISIVAKSRPQAQAKNREATNQMDVHQWLNIMDTFADGIYKLEELHPDLKDFKTDPKLPDELKKDVTVALIDDGVSYLHMAVADKLASGKSFDSGYGNQEVNGAPEPYYGSTTGHGTYMAYMIGRVCPRVKIFVCKLDVVRKDAGGKATFTAKSAADAVEYAIARGFDIISMSWTIQHPETDDPTTTHHLSRLQSALEKAKKKNILLFASAPDIGASSRTQLSNYYPFGRTSITGMFKIGAAKADGTTWGWSGNSDMIDFILPGHNVSLKNDDKIYEEDDIPLTGSSVATALASGLAALIIHCVRLGALYNYYHFKGSDNKSTHHTADENTLKAIKEFEIMKEAFKKVSPEYTDKDKRLEVETFFKKPAKDLASSTMGEEEKWGTVVQLARDLVSYNSQTQVGRGH